MPDNKVDESLKCPHCDAGQAFLLFESTQPFNSGIKEDQTHMTCSHCGKGITFDNAEYLPKDMGRYDYIREWIKEVEEQNKCLNT